MTNLQVSFSTDSNLSYLKELLVRQEIQDRIRTTANAVKKSGSAAGKWDLRTEMESMSDSDKQDVLTWALTPTLGVRAKAHGMQRTVHSINPRLTGVAKKALVKVFYSMEEFKAILDIVALLWLDMEP